MAATIISTSCGGGAGDNPLLKSFDTPHGTPPFEHIELRHYMPAFERGIAESRAEIAAIASNAEAPTFTNTIEALERQGALLTRVATIFFALNSSETSDEMDELANRVQPLLTELSNDVYLNPELFKRVEAVYEAHKNNPLPTPEQRMLLENTYRGFIRSGAGLSERDKERYRAITTEFAALSLKFGQNVLAETNAFFIHIPTADEAKLEGMPGFVVAGMAAEAADKGLDGWVVTLQAPSYTPFLTYSRDSEMKKELWMRRNTLCDTYGPADNRANTVRMVELRLELSRLLGYDTYADFVLEERMARTTATVNGFLDELLTSTREWAVDEYREISDYAKKHEYTGNELMPWDFPYYSERYKAENYQVNDEETKPYFRLENVEKGVFMLAGKLFGITFKENKDIQVYHPDVKAFEVYDGDGAFLSVLYMDYFPRAGKRGGAWMTTFRDMSTTADGTEIRPLVTLCFNFTKPVGDTPALLTFSELTTTLHEFGHALHGMFAEGTYASLTGTAVYRDFVELPSQIMENWATEKEFLDMWAEHYRTGEKIPAGLVGRIVRARDFLSAYGNVRQLSFGINDMAWHTVTAPVTVAPEQFERKATSRTQILPFVPGTCFSTSFTHIFAGGYAAGYYGYKWAEVLEADAFSLFRERGIFNTEVARSFRENILSKGGSEDPMTLFVRFRGHEPQTAALIEKIRGDER